MATLNANTFKSRNDAEAHYLGLIDVWATEKRSTDPAQETIYWRKALEANAGGGPLLNAEAEALRINTSELCERVKASALETETAWYAIEIKRVTAKSDIRAAQTAAQMHAIYQQLRAN
ncbi:hypothetical protein [Vreelandella venusta]|uniref:hypothetical protein n=1 Tax=Vreelandella venusta TaxID=44935 RepID=UPI00200FA814|nr:hypothetical protein [Halomonas venusta]UQI38799.1 hypothetical protein M3L73_11170 [Halomonas venusta]